MSGTDVHFFCDIPEGHIPGPLWTPWAIGWWVTLFSIATFNIAMYAALTFCYYSSFSTDAAVKAYQQFMKNVCAPYVFVCAYRSYMPAQYPLRYVWFDTPLSSILLVRSLAAVAEMCFIAQIAKALSFIENQVNDTNQRWGNFYHSFCQASAVAMVIIMFVAQCFSFAGTITKNNLWYACEEFNWGLAFAVGMPFFFVLSYQVFQLRKETETPWTCSCNAMVYAVGMSAFCLGYVPYMFVIDAPEYWQRYQDQLAEGFEFLNFWDGVKNAAFVRHHTHLEEVWQYATVWQTAYFSAAVWLSLLLALAPKLEVASTFKSLLG
ncbi:unnamed protein product [Effrenium voratum]|nr:unnamed protein product [Effrenium voratum]|mmetsp:Transcript_121147/g.287797  ORF Transcript_121147/g.287797 Transcript_121147/m.287797 type:complete len:321 (-) Transcript_121147:158-1120(-)